VKIFIIIQHVASQNRMKRIYEAGLVNYQDRLWKYPKPPCMIKEEFVSVGMSKISPAFVIVAVGIILALIVLAGERITRR
jgi:preprotein translocase subunit Sec61beta